MQSKLTLRLDEHLIKQAKAHAKRTGKSVSQLVADYFALLKTKDKIEEEELPPVTKMLYGALGSVADIDEKDYYTYLEEKHR